MRAFDTLGHRGCYRLYDLKEALYLAVSSILTRAVVLAARMAFHEKLKQPQTPVFQGRFQSLADLDSAYLTPLV